MGPERVKNPNRECRQRGWMPLVHVKAAAQGDDLAAAQGSDDDSAFVAGDCDLRKARYVTERNAHGVRDRFGESAQSGAEDDPDLWLLGGALANRFRGFDSR